MFSPPVVLWNQSHVLQMNILYFIEFLEIKELVSDSNEDVKKKQWRVGFSKRSSVCVYVCVSMSHRGEGRS